MRSNKFDGFTMIETLVAILILGLVVTASLKLVALSQRGLAQTREREALLRDASALQIRAALDPLDIFGASGDVRWNVSEKTSPLFSDGDIDIKSLGFGAGAAGSSGSTNYETKRWREIEVSKNEKSVVFFLPQAAENVSSGDKM
jgi:prepilin-type N-terminal cleavage/methylation domain-containing protein